MLADEFWPGGNQPKTPVPSLEVDAESGTFTLTAEAEGARHQQASPIPCTVYSYSILFLKAEAHPIILRSVQGLTQESRTPHALKPSGI